MECLISVVIPVYNAEKYVKEAIYSAARLSEVFEVVVVNDGSTDASLKIIKEVAKENSKVKVFSHGNSQNKGRSASRNLGISEAKGSLIAFLDADDTFLENRFKNDLAVFQSNNEIEGVYNAIGVKFYREATKNEKQNLTLTTVTEVIPPEELFSVLLSGKKGYFSIDGLTLKKEVFSKVGLFNEALTVSEDTELFYRISLMCKLQTGVINKPLALRGVHDANIFNNQQLYSIYEYKMYQSLFHWCVNMHLSVNIVNRFYERIWIIRYTRKRGLLADLIYWIYLLIKSPRYVTSKPLFKSSPINKVIIKMKKVFY